MKRIVLQLLPVAAAMVCLSPGYAWADAPYVYGHSDIVSVSDGVIDYWGYTEIDYPTTLDYSTETDVFAHWGTSVDDDHVGPENYQVKTSWSGAATSDTLAPNLYYWLQTNHWILSTTGSDPDGFGGITPAWWQTNTMSVYATGVPGTGTSFYVGTTGIGTNTVGDPPDVTGVDSTTPPLGPLQPGASGSVALYGYHLTATWADPSVATQVTIPGITTSLSYVSEDQVNVSYSIPSSTPPGTITGTLTTPYSPGDTFNFTIHAATLQSQSITFAPIANQTLGSGPVTASATASSGLPVSFSSDTPGICPVSGAQVSLLAAGTCTVRAQQAGNGSWAAAPDVTRSFTISTGGSTSYYKEYIHLGSRVIAVVTQSQTSGGGGGGPSLTASPSSGTGSSSAFTFTATDSAGVTGMHVLISGSLATDHACWMYFSTSTGLSLASDDTLSWSGGSSPANSQCSISGISAGSTALSFSATIAFSSAFAGQQHIYIQASYGSSGDTGYVDQGIWTVPSGSGPTLSVTPINSTGSSSTFTFTASDSAGVTGMHVLFNDVLNTWHACFLYYDASSGLSLASDDTSTWSGGSNPSNSRCAISSIVPLSSGGTLSFRATISFTGFSGQKNVYVQASYGSGGDTGYQSQGTWTIP